MNFLLLPVTKLSSLSCLEANDSSFVTVSISVLGGAFDFNAALLQSNEMFFLQIIWEVGEVAFIDHDLVHQVFRNRNDIRILQHRCISIIDVLDGELASANRLADSAAEASLVLGKNNLLKRDNNQAKFMDTNECQLTSSTTGLYGKTTAFFAYSAIAVSMCWRNSLTSTEASLTKKVFVI